jgi:hypothetical protein
MRNLLPLKFDANIQQSVINALPRKDGNIVTNFYSGKTPKLCQSFMHARICRKNLDDHYTFQSNHHFVYFQTSAAFMTLFDSTSDTDNVKFKRLLG